MSDHKHLEGAAAAARATRANTISDVRKKAEHVIEQLQSDVLHLIDNAHREMASPAIPHPAPAEAPERASADPQEEKDRRPQRQFDSELRAVITEIVRARNELDIAELVRAEVEKQLPAQIEAKLLMIARALKEKLNTSPQNVHKLSELLSRRLR